MLTDFELGWLVGLLEGEGTFRYNGNSQCLVVKMTDEDVIIRLSHLLEKVTGVTVELATVNPENDRCQYQYRVGLSGENARKVMRLIVPYMGHRRKQRIWQSLNKYKSKKVVKVGLSAIGLAKLRIVVG